MYNVVKYSAYQYNKGKIKILDYTVILSHAVVVVAVGTIRAGTSLSHHPPTNLLSKLIVLVLNTLGTCLAPTCDGGWRCSHSGTKDRRQRRGAQRCALCVQVPPAYCEDSSQPI